MTNIQARDTVTEFVGPPGSGKSTLARLFAERAGGTVVKFNGYASGASPGRIGPVLRQLPLMAYASPIDWRRSINLCRRNELMSNLGRGSIWVEDGPLFALSRSITNGFRPGLVARVIGHLNLPDRCIVVEASPQTCLHRLRTLRSGNNQIAKMETQDALEAILRFSRAVELVVSRLPGHVQIDHLNNDSPEPTPRLST